MPNPPATSWETQRRNVKEKASVNRAACRTGSSAKSRPGGRASQPARDRKGRLYQQGSLRVGVCGLMGDERRTLPEVAGACAETQKPPAKGGGWHVAGRGSHLESSEAIDLCLLASQSRLS